MSDWELTPPPVKRLDGPPAGMTDTKIAEELDRATLTICREGAKRIRALRSQVAELRRELRRVRT